MQKYKVYFMAAWGCSSKQLLEPLKLQTPNNSGIWKQVEGTTNKAEADYFIIQDYTEEEIIDPSRTLYFAREPDGAGPIKNYDHLKIKTFSWKENTAFLYTKWVYPSKTTGGVNLSYDVLSSKLFPMKPKRAVCIQSNKEYMSGHRDRLSFIYKFLTLYPQSCDLFGTIRTRTEFKKMLTNNGILNENNCKFEILEPYQYSLSFDNGNYNNFFGTQITDTLLSFVCPIYSGCPNLEDFFPELSFVKFKAQGNLDAEHEFVHNIIQNDNFEKRKEALIEARNLILNKYNIWDSINQAVTTGKIIW